MCVYKDYYMLSMITDSCGPDINAKQHLFLQISCWLNLCEGMKLASCHSTARHLWLSQIKVLIVSFLTIRRAVLIITVKCLSGKPPTAVCGGFNSTRANVRFDKAGSTERPPLSQLTCYCSERRQQGDSLPRTPRCPSANQPAAAVRTTLGRISSGTTLLSSAGLSLLLAAVDVAAFRRGASSPFLLKNDMTGLTLWTFPQLTDSVPWIRGSLHSNASVPHTPEGETGCSRSTGDCCQNKISPKSKPSSAAILSINVLLPGWCGSSIVGNVASPALTSRGRCFHGDKETVWCCVTLKVQYVVY